MDMRNLPAAAGVAISLAVAAPVLAQSQQGGYLGINPRALAAHTGAPKPGSLQGGYLGKSLGNTLSPFMRAPASRFPTSPAAWCDYSLVPDRCQTRAEADHAWCMQHASQDYATCRQTMDYMGWRL